MYARVQWLLPLRFQAITVDSEGRSIRAARWSAEVQFMEEGDSWRFLARLEWCSRFAIFGGTECKIISCYRREDAWELCLFMALLISQGATPQAAFAAAENQFMALGMHIPFYTTYNY